MTEWLGDALRTQIPFGEIVLRLVLGLVFGGIIGLNRELKQKPAGLRTHMLVSLAAATFTVLTFEIYLMATRQDSTIGADPIRVTEAVITGVAFLGAGTIIRARGHIEGITTGASIWLAGAIGLASGAGYYSIALLTSILGVTTLALLGRLEAHLPSSEETD